MEYHDFTTFANKGPIQMIKISPDLKTFEVNQEALHILRQIEGDIGVVTVSGN